MIDGYTWNTLLIYWNISFSMVIFHPNTNLMAPSWLRYISHVHMATILQQYIPKDRGALRSSSGAALLDKLRGIPWHAVDRKGFHNPQLVDNEDVDRTLKPGWDWVLSDGLVGDNRLI